MVNAHLIDNYPAESEIGGFDLAQKMFEQTTAAGAEFINEEVTEIKSGDAVELTTAAGVYSAKAAVIATGTVRSRLNVPGEVTARTIPASVFREVWDQAAERPDGFMGMFF